MQFGSHLQYEAMMNLTSNTIGSLLSEIKRIIEGRITYALHQIDIENISINVGVINQDFLLHNRKLSIYTNTVELLITELNALGHKLIPLDQDIDIDFESTSTSWTTKNDNADVFGLDIEIFPNKANVLWILSPTY